ncbi:M16 family metallopeptidase [Ramlibacter sp.]|uniref:M16 family metallopeptidase n=1 Tax=Ramlibacter sp. TaxID=1917967 RepID=UPI003D116187
MRRILFALCLCFAVGAAQAQLKQVRQVEGVVEYALPNGLTVLVHHDDSKPTATVNITYMVGSRHEGNGETGAAHLLEHMLFKASETVGDPKQEMTRRGARWNGTTWVDRTNYFAQFASDQETLEWMLGWLAESMTRAKLLKSELDTEMTVVRNELERAENNASRILGGRMRSAAYQWHGYARDGLGARSDIENIPIERLREFYVKHYRPDNAVLVLGGRFDVTAALRKVEQTFGAIARPATPRPATYTLEPSQDGERHVVLRRAGGAPEVSAMYHVMPANNPEFAAIRVLAQLLAQDRGPLETGLVDKRLAASRWAWAMPAQEPGYISMGASIGDVADGEAAAQRAVAELVRIVETLEPTQEQFNRARAEVLQHDRTQIRDPESLSLGLTGSVALGDWRLMFAQRDWVDALVFDDFKRIARTWLVRSNRTTGIYVPEKTAPVRAPAPANVNVAQLLKDYSGRAVDVAVADFPLTPDEIQKRVVTSRLTVGGAPGLRVAVLPRVTKESRVQGLLRLRWGTVEAVNGQAVMASLIGGLLSQGTATLPSAEKVREKLLALDANVRFTAGVGGATATFEAPARNTREVMELVAEMLQRPAFADDAFERVRGAAIAANRAAQSDTAALAANSLQRAFFKYPPGDPREPRTLEESGRLLQQATPAQLREFWRRFAGAGVGELSVAGPVDAAQVQSWAQQLFGAWKSAEPHRPWTFSYADDLKPVSVTVEVPEKANASYTARVPLTLNEESPDFAPLFTAVQLLGGRAGTALWQRVREKEGLSYGVNSSLSVPSVGREDGNAGAININASFAPQNRDRLRAVIRDEIETRVKSGFSGIEVGFARRAIASARRDSLAQPVNLVSLLANNLRYGRDMNWYAKRSEEFEKLDAQAVNAALAKYLDVSRLTEVAAGTFGR